MKISSPLSSPPHSRRRLAPVLPDRQRDSGSGTKMLCSLGKELAPPSLGLYKLHSAWAQRMWFFPLPSGTPVFPSCYRFRRVVADRWPGPPGRVLVPMLLWVTPTVLHLAPCSLAAQTVGRDALRAASTFGSPCGNSELLHPTEQAGCRRASQRSTFLPRKPSFPSQPFPFAASEAAAVGVGTHTLLI